MSVEEIKRAALSENWAKVRRLLSRMGLGRSSKYEVRKTLEESGLIRYYLFKNGWSFYLHQTEGSYGRRQAEVSIGKCDEHGRSLHIFTIDGSQLCLKCAADILEAMDDGQDS